MRVIAGSARGQRLAPPRGRDVRPTSDRVREALFSSLGDAVRGAVVLDLFAGTGALGIEALSRGATGATFVERDRRSATLIRANLRRVGLSGPAAVVEADAAAFCRDPRGGPFDVIFCDPPYAEPLPRIYRLLATLHGAGGLTGGAQIVIERDRRDRDLDVPPPPLLALERRRAYGDTVLLYTHVAEQEEER